MNLHKIASIRWIGVLLLGMCSFGHSAPAAVETWKSVSGASIEAEFVELRKDLVVLKTAEGKEIGIPRSRLDEVAQKRIEELLPESSGTAEAVPPADLVGVFREVNHPNYDAVLRVPNGQTLIYPKQNGTRIGDIIEVNLQGRYADGQGRRSRVPLSLREPPVWQNDHVVFKLLLTDDVVADLYYRFQPAGIEMGYQIKEPKGATPTDDYRIQMSFGGILSLDSASESYTGKQFPQPLSRAQAVEFLKDVKIVIDPLKGKSETFSYTESIDHFPGLAKSIQIKGAYKGLGLRVEGSKKASVWARIYQGGEPMGGYSIAFKKEDIEGDVDNPKELLSLQFTP